LAKGARSELLPGDRCHRTSQQSWENAASVAIKTAGQSLRDLRVGEVIELDIILGEGGGLTYRTKLRLSFKYEGGQ
jgi:dodecin